MSNSEVNIIHDEKTISGVTRYLFQHPLKGVILRWNWKAGLLSAIMRAPIFFAAYQKEGLYLALGAMLSQFLFRGIFGGINGTIIQSFTRVEPAWHALLTVPIVLATFSHIAEFIVQSFYDRYTGTTSAGKAIVASVILSAVSAVFNLFAMRRGALLVKDEREQSLWKDFLSFPRIIFDFLMLPSRRVGVLFRRGHYLQSIGTALLTCTGLGLIVWIVRGKVNWGVIAAVGALVFTVFAAIITNFIHAKKFAEN